MLEERKLEKLPGAVCHRILSPYFDHCYRYQEILAEGLKPDKYTYNAVGSGQMTSFVSFCYRLLDRVQKGGYMSKLFVSFATWKIKV